MINSKLFVFDIETIPDIDSARRLLKISQASEEEVYKEIAKYHNPELEAEEVFLKPIFHKIVAISFVAVGVENIDGFETFNIEEVRSGGTLDSSEADLVKGFFQYIEKNVPRIISYNGRSFDLPVLKYRAMKHKIPTGIYKLGDKWNSYSQRYSSDWHCDLHEVLSDYFASGRMKLDEVCAAFSYPGKIDVDGSSVYNLYKEGKIQEIRDYCETDVLNTYLVYLNYALHSGIISSKSFEHSIDQLDSFLSSKTEEHFKAFLTKWNDVRS